MRVGVPNAVVTPGNPNAHFSFSFGVVSAVSPARGADWNRVFAASAQPFQSDPFELAVADAGREEEHFAEAGIVCDSALPMVFAIVSRSAAVIALPTAVILPVSSAARTDCHDIWRSVSGRGAPTVLVL